MKEDEKPMFLLGSSLCTILINARLIPVISILEIYTTMALGALFGCMPGAMIADVDWVPMPLLFYGCSISIAHLFEYLFVCAYHPDTLHWDSFLINQSLAYGLAHTFALAEYFVELLLIPDAFKINCSVLNYIGFIMLLIGHFFRIGAMFTAA